MKIELTIPKEFIQDYRFDRFELSFEKCIDDLKHSENHIAWKYDIEVIEMLKKAFKESKTYKVLKSEEETKYLLNKEDIEHLCMLWTKKCRLQLTGASRGIEDEEDITDERIRVFLVRREVKDGI